MAPIPTIARSPITTAIDAHDRRKRFHVSKRVPMGRHYVLFDTLTLDNSRLYQILLINIDKIYNFMFL